LHFAFRFTNINTTPSIGGPGEPGGRKAQPPKADLTQPPVSNAGPETLKNKEKSRNQMINLYISQRFGFSRLCLAVHNCPEQSWQIFRRCTAEDRASQRCLGGHIISTFFLTEVARKIYSLPIPRFWVPPEFCSISSHIKAEKDFQAVSLMKNRFYY
jgi:hypothetical protein